MSLETLPYDVFRLLLEALRDGYSFPDKQYIDAVKALRLTSRSLNLVATGILFKSLRLYVRYPHSLTKLKKVLEEPILVKKVRVLTVVMDIMHCYDCQSNITHRLSLSSMPNLEEIIVRTAAGSAIHFQRCLAKNTRNAEHQIFLSLDGFQKEKNGWANFVSDLANVALVHGYELDLLHVNLDDDLPFWLRFLPIIDLRYLHTLYLETDGRWDSPGLHEMVTIVSPALCFLPSLVHVSIVQRRFRWVKNERGNCDFFHMLLQEHHWPSVRHILNIEPTTTLTSLKRFLLPHQRQLLSLALYGEYLTMTVQDFCKDCAKQSGMNRDDNYPEDGRFEDRECGQVLQAWIKQKIAPQSLTVGSLFAWLYPSKQKP